MPAQCTAAAADLTALQARPGPEAGPSSEDDWELDPAEIAFHDKIASGAFGDLYRGVYCGQDVAIKILRNVQTNTQQFAEFQQVRPRLQQLTGFTACQGRPCFCKAQHAWQLQPHCRQQQPLLTSHARRAVQEVSIMRKVRHRNVVQFIGACTKRPNLCIVFEFMTGGSVYDHLRQVLPACCLLLLSTCLL